MLKRTLAALIVALTAFCGGTAQAEPLKLTFSTGSVGGGFFAVGSGIAGFASQKIPGISITAISAAGVVESINRLEQGKADFAMLNTQDPPLAWEGKAPYKKQYRNMRGIGILYMQAAQPYTLKSSGIRTFKDLKGKTLSVVHRVVSAYHHYDGKPVWCPRRKRMVTQRVKVISNVSLAIPYEDFVSLEQVVLDAERKQVYDDEHDTLTVTLVLGDEFSVQMNSRNFKTNIDPLFLNTILTCRHYYISLYYTAQRFGHVDALLRQVTSYVVECDKLWRFQRLKVFDAWELENATNTQLLRPLTRGCWFVRNRDYEAYNTLACVGT